MLMIAQEGGMLESGTLEPLDASSVGEIDQNVDEELWLTCQSLQMQRSFEGPF